MRGATRANHLGGGSLPRANKCGAQQTSIPAAHHR